MQINEQNKKKCLIIEEFAIISINSQYKIMIII